MLHTKCGTSVRMSVHRNVLAEHSKFFADKLSEQPPVPQIEILECDDVEIYVETVGLMYAKDVKRRLIKQSVSRVLRILKIAETLGFHACIKSCLDYLEAVPWEGEEEEKVVSSIRHLQDDGYRISPILNRVASGFCHSPNDTLSKILEMVLESGEGRGRREMKSLVLKLLKENLLMANGSADISVESLYASCRRCLESLLDLFRHASESAFTDLSQESRGPVERRISLAADNLLWLVEILVDQHASDEFATLWASQNELAELHSRVSITSRRPVNYITSRLFVGIGKGELLLSKETRKQLLHVWLQPLIDDYGWLQYIWPHRLIYDYSWLQHGCRGFDRKEVDEGIGRTILTLPLEEQQSILLSWLGTFLKSGDSYPNLERAFEVWWRRTFTRPPVICR
ncbi:BTB/POZ domain-containing protein At3g50780-like [Zingiber officinale]|uniref:BTB/POZ domain-containing protein At3g50780-like n=1 Tax=Zingiber officinale TaxID=94328 RepID=UPI001C4B8EC8|nr:BTB/POZ domain-containing protein At3g50780-like [Zingiber officinale]